MRPVFIGGCGRSGTTLLGAMLGAHHHGLATPESKFNLAIYYACMRDGGEIDILTALNRIKAHWSYKIWNIELNSAALSQLDPCLSYPELIIWLVTQYGHQAGKVAPEIWVDHTPGSIIHAGTLFKLFPNAKLIHLVRDGRATASSVMKLDWGPNTIEAAAYWWINKVAHGLAAESFLGPERVRRIRYEDLVLQPEATLKEICLFLQLDYQPDMVNGTGFQVPYYTSQQHALVGGKPEVGRVQAWRRELPPRQIEIFESIAGNMLNYLEYEPLYGLRARKMTHLEQVTSGFQELYRRQVANKWRRQRRFHQSISIAPHESE